MYLSDPYLDSLILEDVPYADLTTTMLGIGTKRGEIEYFTREDCTLACTDAVRGIMGKLGITISSMADEGGELKAGETFLVAHGTSEQLHTAWKVCLNIFDYYSAVATKAHRLVSLAHSVDRGVSVLTTRKSIPGTKPLIIPAILAGGAFPHRLGLSETILVFGHHLEFLGGMDSLIDQLPAMRAMACEKKIIVESGVEDAERLVRAGVDGIQFDKVPAAELEALIPPLKRIDPHVTFLAAGGIDEKNITDYAGAGVSGIVTTCLFHAKPLDMSVRMRMQ